MKFFAVLFAAAVAAVSAQTCDLAKLQPLMTDPSFTECKTESGLAIPPTAVPTAADIKKACSSKSCATLVAKVKATGVTTCKIGTVDLITDLLEPIAKECKFDGAAPPAAGNETAPAKPENAPAGSHAGSHAGAPKETVEVPKDGSHAAGSHAAGSHAGKDDAKPSKKDVPAPATSKPASSASSAAVAAGAAVVAVAAALL
ncbi:hypothetical protein PINS_up010396 [Pythium insidiosum]|nr:hypothetical protein PINS_up010396 [Pythium insidiosum]